MNRKSGVHKVENGKLVEMIKVPVSNPGGPSPKLGEPYRLMTLNEFRRSRVDRNFYGHMIPVLKKRSVLTSVKLV